MSTLVPANTVSVCYHQRAALPSNFLVLARIKKKRGGERGREKKKKKKKEKKKRKGKRERRQERISENRVYM